MPERMLTLDEFVILTYRMRKAQRAYLRQRSQERLEKLKWAESQVDDAVAKHTARQPTLFPEDEG